MTDPSETIRSLRKAADGDETAWQQLLQEHRARLHRLVKVRMDRRIQARVDASDVVQDALVDAWECSTLR